MKTRIQSIVLALIALAPAMIHASPFEIRLVLPAPSEDSESLVWERADFKETLHVAQEVLVGHRHVADAKVEKSSDDRYHIHVQFTEAGAKALAAATRAAKGGRVVIMIDGEIFSAPRVQHEITSGSLAITGRFDLKEARKIAAALKNLIPDDGRRIGREIDNE